MCPPRDQLLLDPTFRDSDEILRTESLLAGRDVVPLAGEEIKGTCDQLEVQAAAEPHELALGQVVLLEELADRLQLPAPGQVERIFVPAVETPRPSAPTDQRGEPCCRNPTMKKWW